MIVGVVTIALTSTLVSASAAAVAALPGATELQEYEIDRSFLGTTSVYGALQPESRRIVIGQNTSVVQFDPGIEMVPGSYLACGAGDGVFPFVSYDDISWNAEAVHSFAIEPGVIPPGAGYEWTCREGEEESDTVTWFITAAETGPETLMLEADPSTLVSVLEQRNYSGTDFESREVSPGDRVEISAPENTWGRPGASTVATVTLLSDGGAPDDAGDDVTVSPNGNLLAFTVPTDLEAGFFNGEGWVEVSTVSTVAGSATTPRRTHRSDWSTRFIYPDVPRGTSETSIRLNRPFGISTRSSKALVTVRTSDVPLDFGYVVLYVDGKLVGRKITDARQSFTVEFTVPKLGRGNHTLRAEFEQSQWHEGSTSETVTLRILI